MTTGTDKKSSGLTVEELEEIIDGINDGTMTETEVMARFSEDDLDALERLVMEIGKFAREKLGLAGNNFEPPPE